MPGMRAQFMCHWQFAELADPGKVSWNLEPWRPEVDRRRDGGRRLQSRRHRRTVLVRSFSRENVAALVDHTLLKPEATEADVVALAGRGRRTRGVRGVRIAVDGGTSPSRSGRPICSRFGRGFPVGQTSFGRQGRGGPACRRGRRRRDRHGDRHRIRPAGRLRRGERRYRRGLRGHPRLRRPQGDRRVGRAAEPRRGGRAGRRVPGRRRAPAPISSRPPPGFIPAAARPCAPSS